MSSKKKKNRNKNVFSICNEYDQLFHHKAEIDPIRFYDNKHSVHAIGWNHKSEFKRTKTKSHISIVKHWQTDNVKHINDTITFCWAFYIENEIEIVFTSFLRLPGVCSWYIIIRKTGLKGSSKTISWHHSIKSMCLYMNGTNNSQHSNYQIMYGYWKMSVNKWILCLTINFCPSFTLLR